MVSRKYSKRSSSKLLTPTLTLRFLAPIIVDALVDDGAAGAEILDAVGARSERRFERVGADVAFLAVLVGALPPVLGQHHDLADDLRQLAVARAVEGEGDLALAGFLDLDHVAIIGGELRAVLLGCVEREDHVLGRHRHAVVPFRFRAQPVRDRREIVRIADRFGEQPIGAGDFVEREGQQRVVDKPDAGGEGAFDAGDDDVQIVERADGNLPRRAAFRRGGVDVVELLEAFRIFQVAEQRQAVTPFLVWIAVLRLRGGNPGRQRQSPRGQREHDGFQQGSAIHIMLQCGAPIWRSNPARSNQCRPQQRQSVPVIMCFSIAAPACRAKTATKWPSHPRGCAAKMNLR